MTQQLISKRVAGKKLIEIYAEQAWNGDKAMVVVIDGQRQKMAGTPGSIPAQMRKAQRVPAQFTHLLAGVAITADEMEAYNAIAFAHPKALRMARERLVRQINAIVMTHDEDRAAAWDREDIAGALADDPVEVEVLRQQLAEFDAAHPEVVATLDAERATATERNRWM